jgi:hypothetical protein
MYLVLVLLILTQLCIQVRRLEQLLEEERYMRSILENALEHAAVKLSDLSLLPNEVSLKIINANSYCSPPLAFCLIVPLHS